ncbi:hypothetical protein [Herbaspirillum huttiense]|uniref:Uncharacterized protein n=2 Tax=Herbaspirillum huttiense TaxID=863372 RepID=A0AAJ2H8W4_9BURK|nr:hypothetical protein [Herbaspirillum huttiense]MDR9836081.1 hypothetical protein [Herbaspirillum huttiense]
MSLHEDYIFPLQAHLAQPDWPALEQALLAQGFIIPPRGEDVPGPALQDLLHLLCRALDCGFQWKENIRTTGDVLRCYVESADLPADFPTPDDLTMAETLALLARHGIVIKDPYENKAVTWSSPMYSLGPATLALLSANCMSDYERYRDQFSLSLEACDGPNPMVHVGENLEIPRVPGSDELLKELPPFGSHVDFLGASWEDPAVQWHDERSGRSYRILELDWQYSMALGFRMVRLKGFDRDSTLRLAAAVAELAGEPMGASHLWL